MYEAIILAGGFGTRLKEALPDLPKPMAPIYGRPFLSYLLDQLVEKGFKRVILSVGYMQEKIIDYFGFQYKEINLIYSVEKIPLGTGGATKLALEKCIQDHVYVMNGDTYLDFELDKLEQLWNENHQPIITGVDIKNSDRYGKLEIKDNNVISFQEKTFISKGIINAGCYVFTKTQLKNYPSNKQFSLETDFLTHEVKKTNFNFFLSKSYFIDMGIPEDYTKIKALIKQKSITKFQIDNESE
jgi:D-glycero-alpha-D-manno-heptose 1-phosphate guanylyltransferase